MFAYRIVKDTSEAYGHISSVQNVRWQFRSLEARQGPQQRPHMANLSYIAEC